MKTLPRIGSTGSYRGAGNWTVTRWLPGGAVEIESSEAPPAVFGHQGTRGHTTIANVSELVISHEPPLPSDWLNEGPIRLVHLDTRGRFNAGDEIVHLTNGFQYRIGIVGLGSMELMAPRLLAVFDTIKVFCANPGDADTHESGQVYLQRGKRSLNWLLRAVRPGTSFVIIEAGMGFRTHSIPVVVDP